MGSHCWLALVPLGSQELASGWAGHLTYWQGFRVGLSRAWVVFEPPPPPATERVGPGIGIRVGTECEQSVYCPVMPLPQSSLNPMCTYPDVLLYILLFPCFRVARILKRFVS